MKITKKYTNRGFTLVELLVAMVITVLLMGVLMNVAATSATVLTRAQTRLDLADKTERIFDILESDISSMIIRRDDRHWFYAGLPWDGASNQPNYLSVSNDTAVSQSSNAVTSVGSFAFPSVSNFVFYTSVVDSYDGFRNDSAAGNHDKGGDVSLVEYQLDFRNVLNELGDATAITTAEADSPALFRWLEFPDNAFESLSTPGTLLEVLHNTSSGAFAADKQKTYSLLSSQVYSMSSTFNISYTNASGDTEYGYIALTPHSGSGDYQATTIGIGPSGVLFSDAVEYFDVGTATYFTDSTAKTGFENMVIDSVNVTITILDKAGLRYLENVIAGVGLEYMSQEDLLTKHSYSFTRKMAFPEY